MATINFECKKCNKIFDFNVGKIFRIEDKKANFQNNPTCPFCGDSSQENQEMTEVNIPKLREIYCKQVRRKAIRAYKPGELMSYAAFLGVEKMLNLSFKGTEYKIGDYYCVNPLCDCSEVVLHAFHTHSDLDNPLWKFVYDYKLDKISECEDITEEDSQEVIKKLKAEDNDIFSKRHLELKKELRHPLHTKFFKNKKSPPKIGRNDPCPCGSGKKYKKCCLKL